MKSLKQTGDTIIEVLLCMAIVSGSLVTSYSIARKSLARVRESEERSQSLQLAQQQIERFKQYLKNNPTVSTRYDWPPLPPVPNSILQVGQAGFCFYKDLSVPHYIAPGLPPDNGPSNPRCAANEKGDFYCETNPCPPALTSATTDAAGYTYRTAVISLKATPLNPNAVQDQFYISAGRLTALGQNLNANSFNVVVIPYRIHQ